ncbi:hypothetical protein [Microbulbifer hydrolyticus]|uniref:Aminoglycoside phosphotransferase family enzyme n=1 Tax=Microbulbifer hydrolyticus TaxID=48074 RepID=A0A6P1TCQ3_9GAMM|nr:hypothetical protein [Microbulbifer hydrolyticus]MBB5212092.1 aminoglycoside phosphotransferase family enzyme [Microbulbifer hydrolyticus]QHQ39767.1 hypothetical protein GTQ55_12755 [Microbulbifer hydrolyticus]
MTDPAVKLPDLEDKTRFLLAPTSYPEGTGEVRLEETHMARVFLTDHFVYKMKKPVRSSYLDFSSLDKRYAVCREELRLNRRLTDGTYLDVVPLRVDAQGQMTLDERGVPVEWLVKMRRLREGAALPRQIDRTTPQTLAPLLQRLCDFYRITNTIELNAEQYLTWLGDRCREWRDQLLAPALWLDAGEIDQVIQVSGALLDFIRCEAPLLGGRAEGGHIVEGHGDLRPEHCFLTQPPQVIDCLEFNRTLRCVDPVDELSYLALECELLGRLDLGEAALEFYSRVSGDRPPPALSRFYRAERALLRAQLAAAHLQDGEVADPQKWRNKTRTYLAVAQRYCV